MLTKRSRCGVTSAEGFGLAESSDVVGGAHARTVHGRIRARSAAMIAALDLRLEGMPSPRERLPDISVLSRYFDAC
jgi:hypothetical protein